MHRHNCRQTAHQRVALKQQCQQTCLSESDLTARGRFIAGWLWDRLCLSVSSSSSSHYYFSKMTKNNSSQQNKRIDVNSTLKNLCVSGHNLLKTCAKGASSVLRYYTNTSSLCSCCPPTHLSQLSGSAENRLPPAFYHRLQLQTTPYSTTLQCFSKKPLMVPWAWLSVWFLHPLPDLVKNCFNCFVVSSQWINGFSLELNLDQLHVCPSCH